MFSLMISISLSTVSRIKPLLLYCLVHSLYLSGSRCWFPLVSPVSLPCHFFFSMCFYHRLFCLICMLLFQPNNALPPLWKIFLAWLFREFSWIAFFLQAACGREIEWRTSHFVLKLGGKAERLQEKCQDLNNHCC